MDVQSAQPPPYHFMFDANAHGLGAGAQMEVSKYPGGSIQQEQYRSGYRQFKPVPGRAYVYGPRGNWGNRHYYKYTPIKQNAGASGVLSQIAQPNAYKYKVANLGRMGRVDPQLPRGGSIMRVVGVGGGDDEGDMRAFDSSYDWRNSGQPGPVDVRPATDVGRADLPVGDQPTPFPDTSTQVTQTDLAVGAESGAQTEMTTADIDELMDLLDESVAQASDLEREVKDLRAQINRRAATSSSGTQTVDSEAIKAKVDELAAQFREMFAKYQEERSAYPTSSEGMNADERRAWRQAMREVRRYDAKLEKLRGELRKLHEEAGFSRVEAQEAVRDFEQGLGGSTGIPTGESSQQQQQQTSIPPEILREPRSQQDALVQSSWIGQRVNEILSRFLPAARVRRLTQQVESVVMALFTRAATASIALLIQRVMGILANRPANANDAHDLAEQITNFILNIYNGAV